MMNKELMEALDILEKEKEISKETLFEAIENSLLTACKNHFGKADNIKVEINRETCDFLVYAEKEVVETEDDVMDDVLQIALEDEIHRDVDIVTAYTLKNPYFIEELNQTKYHIYGHAN